MRPSVIGLAERVRGAALPIVGACERDRIARALADLGEVCKRGAGIIEESQRDPAGGELVLNSIVLPARHGAALATRYAVLASPRSSSVRETNRRSIHHLSASSACIGSSGTDRISSAASV